MASPFASNDVKVRERAAAEFMQNIEHELKLIDHRLKNGLDYNEHWRLRIQGLTNSHRSWMDYIKKGCPRVSGATKDPQVTNH